MFWAMMAFTDRAERATDGAKVRRADTTVGAMTTTDHMVTAGKMVAVVAAVTLPAHLAPLATAGTIASPTGGTRGGGEGKLSTGGTLQQTVTTVGDPVDGGIKAGADYFATVLTRG